MLLIVNPISVLNVHDVGNKLPLKRKHRTQIRSVNTHGVDSLSAVFFWSQLRALSAGRLYLSLEMYIYQMSKFSFP